MGQIRYPKLWNWKKGDLHPLADWKTAPDGFGFYEIGQIAGNTFLARYCGRAAGATLRTRLSKHYRNSHNPQIRKHRDSLYFRCRKFDSRAEAKFVEAIHISALTDPDAGVYDWNDREEWNAQFAIEDANSEN